VGGFKGLGHFTIDLSGLDACGGASIQDGTTAPFATSDPPCLGDSTVSAVKWDASIASGECGEFVLVLAGPLASGSVQAGTKAGDVCPLATILGPVCP
jgi:hypothetical protein